MTTMSVLADPPRNTGPDFGKASPLGLLVVVLLLIGVFILVWSMNRHLKKLPATFDREHPEPDQTVDEGTIGVELDEAGDADRAAERSPHEPGG